MVGKDPNATKNCERWLNKMIEGGGEADVVTFNSVINAFAREAIYNGSTSCTRAEHWYKEMVSYGIEPTIITYGSLLKAWSNSRSPEGPERAEQQEKQQASGEGQLQDAVVLYNSVVNSWVASGRPDALDGAIRVVSLMEESASGNKFVPQPDVITYNTLIEDCSEQNTNQTKNVPLPNSPDMQNCQSLVADKQHSNVCKRDGTIKSERLEKKCYISKGRIS
jgi:hypothetical protein